MTQRYSRGMPTREQREFARKPNPGAGTVARVNRRTFVVAAAGTLLLPAAFVARGATKRHVDVARPAVAVSPHAYHFFAATEATFVDAAVARLIPADAL